MSSADRIAWIARIDALTPWLPRASVGVAVVAVVLAWTFHAGRAAGANAERARTVDSVRTVIADSSKAIEQRMAVRAPLIVKADTAASVARAKHAAIAQRIVPVTDSTVSIDGAAPVSVVPASLVIPEIRTCQAAMMADTIDAGLIRAQLAEMTDDRDKQRARWELDEANAPKIPRFGFKSGLVAGVALVVSLLTLAR